MKGYNVTAKYGNDTIKFVLPLGCKQETLSEALHSAQDEAIEAFGLKDLYNPKAQLKVTIQEYYED